MFKIDKETKQIYITRGDIMSIIFSAKDSEGTDYEFDVGDVIRFGVFPRKSYETPVLQKDIEVDEKTESVTIPLTAQDTTIGEIINKPVDYWYEIQLNPDTDPQTIIGYDDNGAKLFTLLPEGEKEGDNNE